MSNKKKIIIAILLVVLIVAILIIEKVYEVKIIPSSSIPSDVGNIAPEEFFVDAEENELELADFFNQGKPIVMNFWAIECGPCVAELPHFEKAWQKYGEDVIFLMVNCVDGSRDTVESATEYMDKEGFTFPRYFDITCSAADNYGVYEYPVTVFMTPDGKIQSKFTGSMDTKELTSHIESVLKASK